MTRSLVGAAATALLLGLSILSFQLAEGEGNGAALAGLALVKVAVIGAVFLELDRAWPPWSIGLLVLCAGILGGSVALMAA